MANLKDIKTRILSVENTKKITRAMKMVAAARVKKAENSVKSARPFSDELIRIFKQLLKSTSTLSESSIQSERAIENYPEFLSKREIKSVGMLVITSNKGLAGAYNANIIRNTLNAIKEYKSKNIDVKLFVVGTKGITALKRKAVELGAEISKTYPQVMNEISSTAAEMIAEDLAKSFINKDIDKIEVFTTKFKNMMSYSAQKWDLVPVSIDTEEDSKVEIDPIMLFEPSESAILQHVMPLYLTNTIYQALLEATASELASRMTAMSAANNAAEEMIRTLSIEYNKARQAAITNEIIEVASGADALKG